MKYLLLLLLSLNLTLNTFAYNVSGIAKNSESGSTLSGFDILVTYTNGGIAGDAVSQPDGTFVITDIPNGTYGLEFYPYPDPIMIDGDYFLRTIYDGTIEVNDTDFTGIEFNIPPHHPKFVVTGTLYDAATNQPLQNQNLEIRLKMQYYAEFFDTYSEDDGSYLIDNIPDWTYNFTVFGNEYYNDDVTDITINTSGSDTIRMDFYLEPKSGVIVSGRLYDCETNEPIKRAGRTVKLDAINALFTQTDSTGRFVFVNVQPGYYASLTTTSLDTAYFNLGCEQSGIESFYVPDTGISNVSLYQRRFISIHKVTANDSTFTPGETQTIRFSVVNDDLSYGSIWGINLIFPEGVTVVNASPFYNTDNNEMIFDKLPDCSTNNLKAWEGWHFVGIPPYASAEGNLDVQNESAWTDVTVAFADSASMEVAPVFYEIFYAKHCFSIQPFSYGTVMMKNRESTSGVRQLTSDIDDIISYPNPVSENVTFGISLEQPQNGKIYIYDVAGRVVLKSEKIWFNKGKNERYLNVSQLQAGIYYYSFIGDNIALTGKLIKSDK